jgi:chemotaxis protein MotB
MSGPKARPIIVRRPSRQHGGHHGGAWKVAYADFVTAMMAFFMVMWIMGMDAQTKELVQGYFQNPVGFKQGFGAGQNPLSRGNSMQHQGAAAIVAAAREYQNRRFASVAQEIRIQLQKDKGLSELSGSFMVEVTDEGLRIEMTEQGAGDDFFGLGSAAPREAAVRALALIGGELKDLDNPLIIEGHTDARPYGGPGYSNWELSVDRANAVRRLLLEAGVPPGRVEEVRGHADRHPRIENQPFDPANRRVSILLPFVLPESNAAVEISVGTQAAGQASDVP